MLVKKRAHAPSLIDAAIVFDPEALPLRPNEERDLQTYTAMRNQASQFSKASNAVIW